MTYDELLAQVHAETEYLRIKGHGNRWGGYVTQTDPHLLVKQAYEAGKEHGIALKETDLAENWHDGYQRGIEDAKECNDMDSHHEGFQDGYDAAAKDPKAWYVTDKHGEHVHIGDKVKLTNGETVTVQGLGSCAIFAAPRGSGYTIFETDYFEKVIPDTREKIIEDLSACFAPKEDGKQPKQLADWFVARVEALGGLND